MNLYVPHTFFDLVKVNQKVYNGVVLKKSSTNNAEDS